MKVNALSNKGGSNPSEYLCIKIPVWKEDICFTFNNLSSLNNGMGGAVYPEKVMIRNNQFWSILSLVREVG